MEDETCRGLFPVRAGLIGPALALYQEGFAEPPLALYQGKTVRHRGGATSAMLYMPRSVIYLALEFWLGVFDEVSFPRIDSCRGHGAAGCVASGK